MVLEISEQIQRLYFFVCVCDEAEDILSLSLVQGFQRSSLKLQNKRKKTDQNSFDRS